MIPKQNPTNTKILNPLNIKFMTEEETMKYLISINNKK